MRRRILKAAGVLVCVLALVLISLFLYIKFGDLNRHGDMVGRLLTDALGREIRIGGRFEPAIGLTTTIVVEDITLANPDWSVEPAMVHADHLGVTFDLLSLFSDDIQIDAIEATGVRIALEADANGRASWDFDSGESGGGEPVRLGIGSVQIDDFELSYSDAELGDPIDVALVRAEVHSGAAGMLWWICGAASKTRRCTSRVSLAHSTT